MRCGTDERQRQEQLCRTITRVALANERVQCNAAGQVVRRRDLTRSAHGEHAVGIASRT